MTFPLWEKTGLQALVLLRVCPLSTSSFPGGSCTPRLCQWGSHALTTSTLRTRPSAFRTHARTALCQPGCLRPTGNGKPDPDRFKCKGSLLSHKIPSPELECHPD